LRFSKLIPLLTHPTDPRDAFDVVVPSLPGYLFSDEPKHDGSAFELGTLWHSLMVDTLGYQRFGAHGGDWGSVVTEQLARSHSSAVVGIHLTDVPFWHFFQKPKDLTPAEEAMFAAHEANQKANGAYGLIQGSRPQTLADGLNDSPGGLAAWWVEKFQQWSDCGGDVESKFSKDDLLTTVTTYWVTQTAGSSFLPYFDFVHAGIPRWVFEKAKELVGSSKVPMAFAQFPKDIGRPPREFVERFFNVQRFTEMPRGGHFAAWEEPELLARDLREFFRPLR
jgi:pimeloyl-ACP methyl ester carboxylesterase